MIDTLFAELLNQAESFLELAKLASKNLTAEAIAKQQPTAARMEGWKKFIANTEQAKNVLREDLKNDNFGRNKKEMLSALLAFRQLSRYFSEVACTWSTCYPKLNKVLADLYSTRIKIEKKYLLGQHNTNNNQLH